MYLPEEAVKVKNQVQVVVESRKAFQKHLSFSFLQRHATSWWERPLGSSWTLQRERQRVEPC